MARQRNRRIQYGSKLFGSFDARLTSTVEERGCLSSLNIHISKSSGNKINRRNQPGLLYLTRLHKYIGAWRILKSIWRFFFVGVAKQYTVWGPQRLSKSLKISSVTCQSSKSTNLLIRSALVCDPWEPIRYPNEYCRQNIF